MVGMPVKGQPKLQFGTCFWQKANHKAAKKKNFAFKLACNEILEFSYVINIILTLRSGAEERRSSSPSLQVFLFLKF